VICTKLWAFGTFFVCFFVCVCDGVCFCLDDFFGGGFVCFLESQLVEMGREGKDRCFVVFVI